MKRFKGISQGLIIGVFFLVLSSNAYAGNGFKLIGIGTRDGAMAGSTSASAKDTSIMVRNPAGLTKLGNSFDFGLTFIYPQASFDSKGTFGNGLGEQDSDIDLIFALNAGLSLEKSEIIQKPVAFGIGLFPIAGLDLKLDNSRLGLATGLYDRKFTLQHVRMTPSAAVEINDKLSLGLSINVGYSAIKTDLTRSDFTETQGKGELETAWGAGYTIGLLYQLTNQLNVGLSYESETWMQEFDKYKDVLPRLDIPPVAHIGLAYQATDKLEITFDYSYIENQRSTYLKRLPINGGFGWRNQNVFALGVEYVLTDNINLRAGYNYGKSPIREDVIFANGLAPLVTEHHLTMGTSIKISDNTYFDFTYEHAFENSIKDNGQGDTYSQMGVDSESTLEVDIFSIGITKKF